LRFAANTCRPHGFLQDSSHLLAKCPLYGRLSRVEKRAAVLRFGSALVQRERLARNVLVRPPTGLRGVLVRAI
jgi:hypothetical protein